MTTFVATTPCVWVLRMIYACPTPTVQTDTSVVSLQLQVLSLLSSLVIATQNVSHGVPLHHGNGTGDSLKLVESTHLATVPILSWGIAIIVCCYPDLVEAFRPNGRFSTHPFR